MPSDLVARGFADRDDFLATMVVVVERGSNGFRARQLAVMLPHSGQLLALVSAVNPLRTTGLHYTRTPV